MRVIDYLTHNILSVIFYDYNNTLSSKEYFS